MNVYTRNVVIFKEEMFNSVKKKSIFPHSFGLVAQFITEIIRKLEGLNTELFRVP